MEHDYQKRVVEEKRELDEKLVRLNTFLVSALQRSLTLNIARVDPAEEERLQRQAMAMENYSNIVDRILLLAERIEAFRRDDEKRWGKGWLNRNMAFADAEGGRVWYYITTDKTIKTFIEVMEAARAAEKQ